jgi:hypothetical protein
MKATGLLLLLCLLVGSAEKASCQNNTKFKDVIMHDPDIDFKQRRGLVHDRKYLHKTLAAYHLNIDSLQDVVDRLNHDTKSKEWEYMVSTQKGSEGQIRKFYKSHVNADGTSGKTTYGDEKRKQPDR